MPARVVSARDGARPSVVLHLISAGMAEGPPHSALSDFSTRPSTRQQNSLTAGHVVRPCLRIRRLGVRIPSGARKANNNFGLPDIDTGTPADHHIRTSLRPPNTFAAVEPGGISRVNDAVRRTQSKQLAVPNATPGSV